MNSTILCINYILQHEAEDFFENPGRDHIYYHATVSAYGEDEAELTLQEALDEIN
jgi:UDP-N-acetylmuramyl tripeptide synthase